MILRLLTPLVLVATFAACNKLSAPAVSDLTLVSEDSQISFVSVKNGAVAEIHHFTSLQGEVRTDGRVSVSVALTSVETGIPIRNERMQAMLFETEAHPMATLSATLPANTLDTLHKRRVMAIDLPATLDLHGATADVELHLLASLTADGQLHVSTRQPALLQASDFALVDGIKALQEVAGLTSIATMVPVSASLHFAP